MKMTMHIDDALLAKAMALAGAESKTAAVDLALREFVRRGALVEALGDLDLSPDELREAFDPAYDLAAMRRAETPAPYARKPRARR
ncbi:MAG: type II toxin-antitoxin system VapB family antitoxin [Verrucomicrobiales bacterium]|nr:type II toxin-antitoxin system VapB family antitoxin [Verrucomicrobiales bacterium]